MSTALVSAFYDVDDVLYQNRFNSNMTRTAAMNMEPRKITGMTNFIRNQQQQIPPQQQQYQQQRQLTKQQNQFRNRTGSISSNSSAQSDSGYSSNMSMGSPSSTSSMISSNGGSMPPSPVDYRKQFDRSVSYPFSSKQQQINTTIAAKQDQQNNMSANPENINQTRYKTELCRPFEENGFCKYADKCQFAHGSHELRSLDRHPKYKTELCRTYHTIGFCPYGPRCHFIHNDEERRLSQQNQQAQALQGLQQKMQGGGPQQTAMASQQPPRSQFATTVGSLARQQQQQNACSIQQQQQQQHHLRPKSLNFNLATIQPQRESLGSTADSPPSSVTDSPTMSPTFFGEEMLLRSAFSPVPASAPATVQPQTSAFFQDMGVMPTVPLPTGTTSGAGSNNTMAFQQQQQQQSTVAAAASLMAPLNVQTDQVMTLAAQLHALSLANQRNNNINTNDAFLPESLDLLGLVAPPSPPESLASSNSSSNDSIIGTCGSPLDVSRSLRLPIFSKLSCSEDSD